MKFVKASTFAVVLVAMLCAFANTSREARAEDTYFYKTYQVQVEYWFFDTDYTYWSTVYESSSLQDAEQYYELLLIAKEHYQLNEVVGSTTSRYFAIDVRLITVYHYPHFQYQPLKPATVYSGSLLLK